MNSISTLLLKRLAIVIAIVVILIIAKSFFVPLFIAGLLATLFLPLCNKLEHLKIPRGFAVAICFLILLSSITGIAGALGYQIAAIVNDIDLFEERIIDMIKTIQDYIFTNFGLTKNEQSQFLKDQKGTLTSIIQTITGSISTILSYSLFIMVYFFLLLFYRSHIKEFLIRLMPDKNSDKLLPVIFDITRVSQQYLIGLTKMIACLWIMYGIAFSILGISNPLFFAFLCGILEIIPFIGNLTGTTITVLVAAIHGAGAAKIGGVIVAYGLVQLIQGWILEPLILGPQVKINPLFTIIALVLGELVWGIPGVILAIPAIAMFKIACDNIDSMKPYGFLIGETEIKVRR